MTFSGSYDPSDVTFLLKLLSLTPTEVEEKELLIQTGKRHYSEMISAEAAPSNAYMRLFEMAFSRNKDRFASDVVRLARLMASERSGDIAIVSLARAGTPVGVLLRRALLAMGRHAAHYSISIIRDRGIDSNALAHVVRRHGAGAIIFVDGWTGKGAIACELATTIAAFNSETGENVDPSLAVVADLAGVAKMAATDEDYLLPSSILNAVVSGLISRTVLNEEVGPGDFHGCVFHRHLESSDVSRRFVDETTAAMQGHLRKPDIQRQRVPHQRMRTDCDAFVTATMEQFGIGDRNRIKPGIGEATRSLLRRIPDTLIVRDPGHEDVEHLIHLAKERSVPITVDKAMPPPYLAAAVIKTLGEG